MTLSPKQIKRNILRSMGIDLPDNMLDTAHDFQVEGNKIKFRTKATVSASEWKACYGSIKGDQ